MVPEQREALDEAIQKMRAGRMSRRLFLERMAVLGVGASAASAILDACGTGAGAGAATKVHLQIVDAGGYLPTIAKPIIENYGKAHLDKVASIQYLPRVQAPDLPGKLKAQQNAKRVTTSLILTGYDGVASCTAQGLVENIIPNHQLLFPNLNANYLPAAKQYNDLGQGNALVFSYTPSGPLFEYDPNKISAAQIPQTINDLQAWIHSHPQKFLYASPRNSGPGRTLLMGLPYLLGDSNPQDPINGWTKTWAFLKDIKTVMAANPTRTGDTMSSLANDTSWMIASTFGWDINPRVLQQVPQGDKTFALQNTTYVADAAWMMIPKGLDSDTQAVVLDLMVWMLKPDQQAITYDAGYFYPGPAIKGVDISMAPQSSQQAIQQYGRPEYNSLIQNAKVVLPLSLTNLNAAFDKWERDIG